MDEPAESQELCVFDMFIGIARKAMTCENEEKEETRFAESGDSSMP